MTARFASNITTLLAGAFLTSAALGFAPATVGWLAFAAGCLVAASVLLAFTLPGRGIPQRVLDVSIVVLAAWTIVEARSFSGVSVHWLSFASGVALVVLGAVALVVHETLLELELDRTVLLRDGRQAVRVQERPPAGLMR